MTDRCGFLSAPQPDNAAEGIFAEDRAEVGYVMNVSRLWAYDAVAMRDLLGLARRGARTAELTMRERLIVVLASSAARQSRYCILAWGTKFATQIDPHAAESIVRGDETPPGLSGAELALVRWSRKVAVDPLATTSEETDALRAAGWSDRHIFALTVFAATRVAFASINDALGVIPDEQLSIGPAATWIDRLSEPHR